MDNKCSSEQVKATAAGNVRRRTVSAVALAALLWMLIFGVQIVNFWLGMSLASGLLAGLAIRWEGRPISRFEITLKNTLLGLAATATLYGLFALGRYAAVSLLPFAEEQIGGIYAIKQEAAPGLIALILLFVTSPCEEIFWRGFLQKHYVAALGERRGWLLASAVYAGVHVFSGNFILTGAALVAGLFWGRVYLHTRSLYVCILSHALWTVLIFLLRPV